METGNRPGHNDRSFEEMRGTALTEYAEVSELIINMPYEELVDPSWATYMGLRWFEAQHKYLMFLLRPIHRSSNPRIDRERTVSLGDQEERVKAIEDAKNGDYTNLRRLLLAYAVESDFDELAPKIGVIGNSIPFKS